jgi:hypothetical protein
VSELKPGLSLPGALAVGPESPVQRTLVLLTEFFTDEPEPDIGSSDSKSCGLLVANHLMRLIEGCGLLNSQGLHSAAVSMLRPLEDALDCFAAVTTVEGAAERWSSGKLAPSEAAKAWTDAKPKSMKPPRGTLADYRRALRGQFARYVHCSYDLCLWDLFFDPDAREPKSGVISGIYKLNPDGAVIDANAHALDAHLTAHLLEFAGVVRIAYGGALRRDMSRLSELAGLQREITEIMERHNRHRCQDVMVPPEWHRSIPGADTGAIVRDRRDGEPLR